MSQPPNSNKFVGYTPKFSYKNPSGFYGKPLPAVQAVFDLRKKKFDDWAALPDGDAKYKAGLDAGYINRADYLKWLNSKTEYENWKKLPNTDSKYRQGVKLGFVDAEEYNNYISKNKAIDNWNKMPDNEAKLKEGLRLGYISVTEYNNYKNKIESQNAIINKYNSISDYKTKYQYGLDNGLLDKTQYDGLMMVGGFYDKFNSMTNIADKLNYGVATGILTREEAEAWIKDNSNRAVQVEKWNPDLNTFNSMPSNTKTEYLAKVEFAFKSGLISREQRAEYINSAQTNVFKENPVEWMKSPLTTNINPREYMINKEDTGTYTIKFGDDPTQVRTFNNKTAADDFVKQLAKDQEFKINKLTADGIITKSGAGYEIIANTTDMERARLIDAGFNVDVGITAGWSRQLYDWGQQFGDHNWKDKPTTERNLGDFLHGSSEYYASILGTGGLNSLENSIDWLNSFMGKKTTPKSQLTVENLRRFEGGIDPARQAMVYMGGAGASYLATTLAYMPVGVAISGIFTGAQKIATGLNLKAPTAIKKIAQTIASQPLFAKAVLYSTITSLEAAQMYKDYMSGKDMGDVLGREAVRAGAMLGSFHGMDIGFRLPNKIRGWIDTAGRTKIPLEKITSEASIKGEQNIGLYKSASKQQFSDEFKAYGRKMSATEYMGEVAPNEMRLWHGTTDYDMWIKRVGLETNVPAGHHAADKFSGLFAAPELSPLRMPQGAGTSLEGAKLGIPTFGKGYAAQGVDCIVDVMPSGMSRAETQAWLALQAGKRTAYIPPVSMITQEMEAIIPEGSKLRLVGTDWYINWQGVRVPVNKFVLVGTEEVANAAATGVKLVDYSVVAKSTLPTEQVYISFGLIAPSSTTIAKLTPKDISIMAEEYGVTITEMKSIISDTTKMLQLNNESMPETKYKPLSEYLSKSDLTKLTEMDYTKFASDISKMSTTELTSIYKTTPISTISKTINEMTYKQIYEILPSIYSSYTPKEIKQILKGLDRNHEMLFNKGTQEMKSSNKTKKLTEFKVIFFYKDNDVKRVIESYTFKQALEKTWFDRGSNVIPKKVKVIRIGEVMPKK